MHTIIVNRSIGPLHTRMVQCELLGISYPTTNYPEEKQSVDSAIGRFQTVISKSDFNMVKDCFILEFNETITESGFWVSDHAPRGCYGSNGRYHCEYTVGSNSFLMPWATMPMVAGAIPSPTTIRCSLG